MTKQTRNQIETLQKEVEIPSIVTNKMHKTLQDIRSSADTAAMEANSSQNRSFGTRFPKKRLALVAAAMVLLIGTVSFAAVSYLHWSDSLSQDLNGTDRQKQALDEKHISSYVGQSVTKNGVTVTVTQSIVDSYFARVAFKIEGYSVPEGKEPCFETITTSVNGISTEDLFSETEEVPEKDCYSTYSSFYYDFERDSHVLEDGSLEFTIYLANTYNRGYFIDSPIHIALQGLGYYDEKLTEKVERDDTWSFDWTLEGADAMQEYDTNVPLEDTGVTVTHAEVSPISLKAVCEYPENCTYVRPDGEGEAIPPYLTGVKMKDGTLYPYICDMGSEGFDTGGHPCTFTSVFALTQIIDVEEVEALLFVKSYTNEGETPTEENFYQIPLK